MSFKGQLFFDPADIANIDSSYDSIASYLVGGDKAILDKENDTAFAATDRGIAMLAVRQDADASLVDTDGDYGMLQLDDNGRLKVAAEVTVEAGDAEFLEDSAHSDGDAGIHILAVRQDTRPANALTDANGDYASLFLNNVGELWVKDADSLAQLVTIDSVLDSIKVDTGNMDTSLNNIEASVAGIDTSANAIEASTASIDTNVADIEAILTALSKQEDAAHVSGDRGIMSLAVRNDAGTALAADQDYIPLSTDSSGNLRVSGTFQSAVPNTALENKVVSMSDTAAQIDASPLASRKYIMIQNDGNKPVYIGKADVTADTTAATGGFRLNKGAVIEWELGPGVAVYGRCETGDTSLIRLIELS